MGNPHLSFEQVADALLNRNKKLFSLQEPNNLHFRTRTKACHLLAVKENKRNVAVLSKHQTAKTKATGSGQSASSLAAAKNKSFVFG